MTDQSSDVRLAFVDVSVFDDGSIRGGVLVTDLETRPYEFRVTTPVKPTTIQRVLYGKTLSEYVYGELIGCPLIGAVKEKVSLVITKNENMLVMRPKLSVPTIVLTKNSQNKKSGLLEESVGMVVMSAHPSYAGEEDWARTLLNKLIEHQDPFEPFERLRIALDEVHKSKVGA